MTSTLEPRPNRRKLAKARTRAKIVEVAKRLFEANGYAATTIRDIAREVGMSTGAVFSNFTDKADLWMAVTGTEAPVETSVSRAAPVMLKALRAALQFIENGVEMGYIKLPTTPDPALETPGLIRAAIAEAEGGQ